MSGAFWWVDNRGLFQPWFALQLNLIRDLEFQTHAIISVPIGAVVHF